MKKVGWIITLLLLLGAGSMAAGPYRAVSQIKSGITQQDDSKLTAYIDYPALKQGLKGQLHQSIIRDFSRELGASQFGMIIAGLATQIIDKQVEVLVTREGLAGMMAGREPAMSIMNSRKGAGVSEPQADELFRNAAYAFESLSGFAVRMPNGNGGTASFILERTGYNWRLVNIILPQRSREGDGDRIQDK